jgi:hypothetical protein
LRKSHEPHERLNPLETRRKTHLDIVRGQDTGSLDDASKDEIDGDTTRDTDQSSHGRVTVGRTLLVQDRGDGLDLAVGTLDDEGVLEVDQVLFTGLVLHQVFKTSTEGVEQVASSLGGLVGEETELLELGEEDSGLGSGERRQGSELLNDGTAKDYSEQHSIRQLGVIPDLDNLAPRPDSRLVSLGTDDLGGDLGPSDLGTLLQPILLVILEVTELDKRLDHVIKPSVSESSTLNGLSLGNVVKLPKGGRVSVGVTDKIVSRVGDGVRLGLGHQILALNGDDLAITVKDPSVSESEKDTSSAPAELVSERVVGGRG